MSSFVELLGLVGNDTSANRVDSMVPAAKMTEHVGPIERNFTSPLTIAWMPVTAPLAKVNRVT